MTQVAASYAGLVYYDRTLALKTREVVPKGIDLSFVEFRHPMDYFPRQCQSAEWEVSELSASSFLAMKGQGDDRFVGLPVFVSRYFRHSQVYVNKHAVSGPGDLPGKRVGIPDYQMTAGVWVRGVLQDEYGVRPEQVRWFTGGLFRPGYEKRNDVTPPGLSLQVIPDDQTLEGMLDAGELDALISVQPPQSFGKPDSPVERLFPDYLTVERDYFRRTGIFPIMHLVALRRDLYEAHPWVARSLYDAFCDAKEDGYRRMRTMTALAVSLPWLVHDLEEIDELFGGDAFPYGVAANRHVLERLVRYEAEQGLTPREIGVDEMFVPELLDT